MQIDNGLIVELLVEQVRRLKRRNVKLRRKVKDICWQCAQLQERLQDQQPILNRQGLFDTCPCGGPIACSHCGKTLES
jgi:hypothetical protein